MKGGLSHPPFFITLVIRHQSVLRLRLDVTYLIHDGCIVSAFAQLLLQAVGSIVAIPDDALYLEPVAIALDKRFLLFGFCIVYLHYSVTIIGRIACPC